MSNEVLTEIRLQLDGLREDFKQAREESKKHGEESGKAMAEAIEHAVSHSADHLKHMILEIGAVLLEAFAFKEIIKASSEYEQSVNNLNSALAVNGSYTEASAAHAIEYANALQKTTASSRDQVLQGESLLASLGKLSGEGLERATRLSLDLAAGLGKDATTAFQLVAKAAEGHTEALKRYGITVAQTGDKQKDFQVLLDKLEQRFKGLAELQANTFAGAMAQTKHAFEDILVVIGDFVTKSPLTIAVLKFIAQKFYEAAHSLEKFGEEGDVLTDVTEKLLAFGHDLVTFVVAPLELAYNVVNVTFNELKTGIQLVVVALADAASAVTGILAAFSDKFKETDDAVRNFAASSSEVLQGFMGNTVDAAGKIFDFNVSDKADQYLTKMQEWVDAVEPVASSKFAQVAAAANAAMQPVFVQGWDFIVNGFNSAFSRVALTSETFRQGLQTRLNSAFASFRDGVATSFASIGAALVKGENAFAAFGKAILGVFGDLALQLGLFYFLMGLGNLFLNPGAAAAQIAAGLGLIVLGGALKALAGGGGGGGAEGVASGGGGGGDGGGGVAASSTGGAGQQTNNERATPTTMVAVNVQGNILDRRETGLALADVINETFGSNGITYASAGNTA